ncbi:MAG: Rossmann-like and DUF2520 domain-containing protein [Thermodesulfobacteriota bacterium]
MDIGFIGAGTVGTALAVRLREKGYRVRAATSRTRASAERLCAMVDGCRLCATAQEVADAADLVFITTPDSVIPEIGAKVLWRHGQGVVHCSGADSLDILAPATTRRAVPGGFHPLQTFASISQALENLPGSTFAIEAEGPLSETLKEMAIALEGRWICLGPREKVLYHTAAVLASNYMVTLVKLAADLWEVLGLSPGQAIQALLPLLKGTLRNLEEMGIPDCLTGPIARGDVETISKHLTELRARAPQLVRVYEELALHTVPIALAKGRIDEGAAQRIGLSLQGQKNSLRHVLSEEVGREDDAA